MKYIKEIWTHMWDAQFYFSNVIVTKLLYKEADIVSDDSSM